MEKAYTSRDPKDTEVTILAAFQRSGRVIEEQRDSHGERQTKKETGIGKLMLMKPVANDGIQ